MPKHNKYYAQGLKYEIDSINKDISTLSYFLERIPNCSIAELNNLNSILSAKYLAFNTIRNTRHIRTDFNDIKLKITADYPGSHTMKSYIKIGKRSFNIRQDYIDDDSLLHNLVDNLCFHEMSDNEQSKLILKCFTIEKNQHYAKNVLKELKSQKAKDTLSKLLVLG